MATILGAPYVPSSWEKLQVILKLAKVKKEQKAVDLGSGDGRIVMALAKLGAEAHGFEINPDLVFKSQDNIESAGLEKQAFIHHQNYWETDLSSFDIITVYGISCIMAPLEEKLKKELKPGAKVICNFFTFPNWTPDIKAGEVYLYTKT